MTAQLRTKKVSVVATFLVGCGCVLVCAGIASVVIVVRTVTKMEDRNQILVAYSLLGEYRKRFGGYPAITSHGPDGNVSWRYTVLKEMLKRDPSVVDRYPSLMPSRTSALAFSPTSPMPRIYGDGSLSLCAVIYDGDEADWNQHSRSDNPVILFYGNMPEARWSQPIDLYYTADSAYFGDGQGWNLSIEELQPFFVVREKGQIQFFRAGVVSIADILRILSS